ncbi:phosphatase PAP2 family protein [Nonomuraea gerenzanensis]|uniref:Membrane-associated phospholipid phosphatase n=1 Tax=Nonomuraea gerenzanensis TaxID=93944 RepID=A0A1M4E556_9ACTN|nr:phosphatase PAP2 family protein [Nonomuraea gerenzanensis]UBU16162.1 phosphatase PAP2 family protein [Nonomuraea gerenzanensis]SBO93971.1 Membrane-associated phospholipid phosphatase [Nonomuraea gerenzanensis]
MIRAEDVKYYGLTILSPMLLMAAATFGAGQAVLAWPSGEAELNRELAAGRDPVWNAATDFGSSLSDTPYIVALTAALAIVFRLWLRRWRESVFLVAAVWSQSLIFLATTELVGRHRPPVRHLDPAPPTSSFPSGHVSAAVAFYCGVAVVLAARVRSTVARVAIWTPAVAAPLAVGFSRLYRGMHFLTDVMWGLLLGAGCVAMATWAILRHRPARSPSRVAEPLVRAG